MKCGLKITFFLCLLWMSPVQATAQTYDYSSLHQIQTTGTYEVRSTNLTYTPLEPFPGLQEAQSGQGNFGALINGFFKLLINIGAFLAVVTLVIGGILYMISDSPVKKLASRDRIKAALLGVGILASAWLILNSINPQLIEFDRNFLSPAEPIYTGVATSVSNNTILVAGGVENVTLSEVGLASLRDNLGVNVLTRIDEEVLVFDPRAVTNKTVQEEIEAFQEKCEASPIYITPWRVMTIPGSEIGRTGVNVNICIR